MRSGLSWTEGDLPLLVDDEAEPRFAVKVAFSKRVGGVSSAPFESLDMSPFIEDDPADVARNHELFQEAFSVASLKFVKQVHGDGVLDAGFADPVPGEACVLGEGDALVAERGEAGAVVVLTADCVPILLAGEDRIAAVHAGWRGLVAGVIERAAGAVGGVKVAWVGPSMRGCCYEVGGDVMDAFRSNDLPVTDDSHVDPGRAAAVLLRRAGTREVVASWECTHCDDSFYSYRRDGKTGRQAAAIAWA